MDSQYLCLSLSPSGNVDQMAESLALFLCTVFVKIQDSVGFCKQNIITIGRMKGMLYKLCMCLGSMKDRLQFDYNYIDTINSKTNCMRWLTIQYI